MAQEINLISAGQYSHMQVYYMKGAGEEIGGWLNWSLSLAREAKPLGVMK